MISSMCTNTKCTNVHKFNVGKDLKLKCKLEWPNINEELVHELYRSPSCRYYLLAIVIFRVSGCLRLSTKEAN